MLPKYTWDKDRELCKKCIHLKERVDKYSGALVMSCIVSPFVNGSCLDNRGRGPCGKEGKLFEARKE